jgi:hypothetical protein
MYFIPSYYPTDGLAGLMELNFWKETAKNVIGPYLANNRTGVATQFVNARKTCQNMLDNMQHYVGSARLETLLAYYAGCRTVVVSAGPSVQAALPLLKKIYEQQSAVIISCLTMLKPLLAHGIRPHIVTALDYHPISGKFFDGLPDLSGIFFVLEPKVTAVVTREALMRNASLVFKMNFWMNLLFIDPSSTLVVGKEIPDYQIYEGCTVAHLSLAVAMSCHGSRILLLGQDLAFPNMQYYPDQVYSSHKFKSRAALQAGMAHSMKNWRGETVFTDDQMVSYWYRMMEQIQACYCPVDVTAIAGAGHSPHR